MKYYKQKKRLNNSTRNRRRQQRLAEERFKYSRRIEEVLGPPPVLRVGAFSRAMMDVAIKAMGKAHRPTQVFMSQQEWDDLVQSLSPEHEEIGKTPPT